MERQKAMKINVKNLVLGSSNQSKIKEYQEFGLNIKTKTIPNLKEVDGSELEVIIHKTKDLNEENVILEDSSLHVENASVGVNTKWLLNELKNNPLYDGRKTVWNIYLGLIQNNKIYIFCDNIHGKICQKKKNDLAFGFDSIFIPDGTDKNLYELKLEGNKELYSARKKAIMNLINNKPEKIIDCSSVSNWVGSYQNE